MCQRMLVAIDMDGTLLATETEDRLRPREIAALAAVREAGHVVAICTGRNLQSLDSLLDRSDWHPADLPKVLLNGAMVHGGADRGMLAQNLIDRPVLVRLVELFRAHGAVPMVYGTEGTGGHLQIEKGTPNPVMARYIEHRRHQVGAMSEPADLLATLPDAALEVGTIDRKEIVMPLTGAVKAELADQVSVINTRSIMGKGLYYWAEVYHHACSKGTGVRLLVETLALDPRRVIAIGDNFNDLDMFREATVSVAMDGGPLEVQKAADHIAGSAAESGAAVVLEAIASGTFPGQSPASQER